MNRSGFLSFEGYWNRILHDYRLDSIHMTDFVRPYGRHIGMGQEMKLSLFSDVTKQINDHKIYSVAIGVAQADYRSLLSQHVHRRLIGPYGLAFLSAGVLNGCAAEWSEYRGTIAYLVDRGHFEDQILGAHGLLVDIEKKLDKKDEPAVHTGAIAFDTDDNNVAIQAADVIAWASRRNEEPGGLSGEFDPLRGIFEDQYTPDGRPTRPHFGMVVGREWVERFAADVNRWIDNNGEMPSCISELASAPRKTKGPLPSTYIKS